MEKQIRFYCPLLLLIFAVLLGCSKKEGDGPGNSNESGHLFYSGYTAFKVFDFTTGAEKSIINNSEYSHHECYDVTRDGSEIIFYSESLTSTNVTFTIYSSDGTVKKTFQVGQYVSGIPKWSADKSKIAFVWQPFSTYPDKYVAIFSRDGQQISSYPGVDDYAWTSDNRLLMVTANGFYLSNQGLSSANRISVSGSLPDAAGQLDISRDDKRVAFVSGLHIWAMNLDGTDLKQITTSGIREKYPSWSVDGSRLYFTLDASGNCLGLRYLNFSSAQTINVEPGTDDRAPRVKINGDYVCCQSQPMLRP
jgi:Tol biopolymer transport system component